MQTNMTILLLNVYFSVCTVHLQVILEPGKFGLKKGELGLT